MKFESIEELNLFINEFDEVDFISERDEVEFLDLVNDELKNYKRKNQTIYATNSNSGNNENSYKKMDEKELFSFMV